MLRFLLPPGEATVISDWDSCQLGEVSAYFEDGLEWWGAFLFTIYQAGTGRLLVIAASATD